VTGAWRFEDSQNVVRKLSRSRGLNFATKFAVWDWLFGTGYLPERRQFDYGLDGDVDFG
jgi:sterol desaturase/sphingolipid hydroxylase (fatty acid hydroxylase superfamily)